MNLSNVKIKNSAFSNLQGHDGGVLYLSTSYLTLSIENSTFSGNTSSNRGGVAFISSYSAKGQIADSTFVNNISKQGAGAVALYRFYGDILRSTFTDNIGGGCGGSFYTYGLTGTIQDSYFANNIANSSGGAVGIGGMASDGGILHSTFVGNHIQESPNTSQYLQGRDGGAIFIATAGSSDSPIDFGGNRFFNNTALKNGGAVALGDASRNFPYAQASRDSYLTVSEDLVFAGNMANGLPNALFFANYQDNKTLSLAAADQKTIYFYDPISSNDFRDEVSGQYTNIHLTLALNGLFDASGIPIGSTSGTILFDRYPSNIYFGKGAKLYGGKMILQNGASFGAPLDPANGYAASEFTVAPGATLEVAYNRDSPDRKDDGSVFLEGEGLNTKLDGNHWTSVSYRPEIASNFNGDLTVEGKLAFDMPDMHGVHDQLLKVNGTLTFKQGSTIDIDGYTPSSDEIKKDEEHQLVGANEIKGFELSKVTILGEDSDGVDYMSADAFLDASGKAIIVKTILAWNDIDADEDAIGSFTIPKDKEFRLGANLSDRNDVDALKNKHEWDGKTLTKKGDGSLFYYGDATFTGGSHVEKGEFVLASAGSLASHVTVASGASFTLMGQVGQNENYGQDEQSEQGAVNGKQTRVAPSANSADVHLDPGANFNVRQMGTPHGGTAYRASVINGNLEADNANLTFLFNSEMRSEAVMLEVLQTAHIDGANIKLGFANASDDFLYLTTPGEYIDLIKANELTGNFTGEKLRVVQGAVLEHEFMLSEVNGDTLRATLTGGSAKAQASSLPSGWLGGLAMLQTGSDVVANAIDDASFVAQRGEGVIPFGKISGGKSEFAIADGLNLRHFNYLAGLAYGKRFAPGAMTVGAFFEHGQGNFDAANAYGEAGTVRGDSKAHYEGAGILGRFEFLSNAYVEGSLRAGRLSNDYKSRNLEDISGVKAKYKTSANYFGGHVGGGYVFELAEKTHVDVYGKFLWTRVGSDSAKLSTGEHLKFDAMHSERVRAGAKWTTEVTKQVAPYVGIAYEYAFNGKAKSEAEGHQIEAPEFKGGTGIVNMGMTFAPGATVPLYVDLDASGYVGKRQGVAGGVKLKYTW
jgi:hypothetical protein